MPEVISGHHDTHASARWFVSAGAIAVGGVGAVVLLGWMFKVVFLESIVPGYATMKANTAFGFFAAGAALAVDARSSPSSGARRISRILSVVVVVLAALTLLEYAVGTNLGIDELLQQDGNGENARMAPATALAFLFTGLSLVSITWRSPRFMSWSAWLAIPPLFIGALAVVGYAYAAPSLYQVAIYSSMAVHTALCFCVLSLAILAANRTRGFMATFFSDTSGGAAARQLMPVIPFVLFAVGWTQLEGQEAGWYDGRFGLSLMVVLCVTVSIIAIGMTVVRLHRLDIGRQEALAEIVALNIGLRQKNLELESASRLKSEFVSTMSHELRTPLNAIIGFSEVLRDGLLGEMPARQRGFVSAIFNSGKHLLSLINDILDLSKVEAGKMLLDIEPVDVAALLRNGLLIAQENAAARNITLTVDVSPDLGMVRADQRKVKQILYNLISNAVKFTAERGHVTLRASRVTRADVSRASGARPARLFPLVDSEFTEFIRISVADTGIGISPQGMTQLFKPFTQIDSSLARKYEGTGLGLAMVKLLVELHAGSVAVESEVGAGSCFIVWLPVGITEQTVLLPAASKSTELVDVSAPSRVALLVEEDGEIAPLIQRQLESGGFTVIHATSGEAALRLMAQQSVSLIAVDMGLSDMHGLEFLCRLGRLPYASRLPMLIIGVDATGTNGFSLGAATVLHKPLSRQDVCETLVQAGAFPPAPGESLRILVADDDVDAVELMAVRTLGLASGVLRARGGAEAIDVAQREHPDLIMLDLMMPEINGFDVATALGAHSDTAGIPIFLVASENPSAEERTQLDDYMKTIMETTPFDLERLTAETRRAMCEPQLVG